MAGQLEPLPEAYGVDAPLCSLMFVRIHPRPLTYREDM